VTTGNPFIQRHPTLTYFVLVFAISWGGALIAFGPGAFLGTLSPFEAGPGAFILVAIVGPFLAGILATGLVHGREGLRDLRSRLLKWRVSVGWYAVALLTAPLLTVAILLVLSLRSPAFRPVILTTGDKTRLLLAGVVAGVVVPFFEEMGWTGFAIPQLRTRHGVATTGVIVGLAWGMWHFPLFFGSVTSSAAVPQFLGLAVLLFSWLPPYRVLMVWVYNHTESMLIAMLMHLPIVFASLVLIPATPPKVGLIFDLVYSAALWVVVASVFIAGGFHDATHKRLATSKEFSPQTGRS